MKIRWTGLAFLIFLLSGQPAIGQNGMDIDLQIVEPNARVFFLGDFDPTGLGNAPNFYNLILNNLNGSQMDIELRFELLINGELVVEAESNRFTMPPVNLMFTSSQLNTGGAIIPANQESIELKDYNLDFERIEDLQNKIVSTGKLPSGEYLFQISYREVPQNAPPGDWIPDTHTNDNMLIITNPSTLEPLYPGQRVNEGILTEIPGIFPYFFWQSDAGMFNLFVFKKYPEDETIQDALSHDPVLHIEGYPNLVFQYPTDPSPLTFYDNQNNVVGGSVGPIRMLEPGVTYYWTVQAVIPTASDEIILDSDVYQFRVADEEQNANTNNVVLIYLQQILGPRYEEVMRGLEGFSPTGNIFLNNSKVELEVLNDILVKMNQNQAEIQNTSIE